MTTPDIAAGQPKAEQRFRLTSSRTGHGGDCSAKPDLGNTTCRTVGIGNALNPDGPVFSPPEI